MPSTMPNWVVSDLHLGHSGIITHEPARRRFATIAEHDHTICQNWRETVGSHDVVYVLGDVFWSRKTLDLVRNLPGLKKLVMGNHDQLDMRAYLEVFKSVRAYREIEVGDDTWLLAHIPVHPASLTRWAGQIHGHTHGKGSPPAALSWDDGVNGPVARRHPYISACLELTDFRPIEIGELIRREAVGSTSRGSIVEAPL